MLQRISVEGIQFPRLYIAENAADVRLARQNGLPYVRWKFGQEALIRQLLRPALEKMFPGINWNKVLGYRQRYRSKVIITHPDNPEVEEGIAEEYDGNEMLSEQHEYDDIVDDLHHDWATDFDEDGAATRVVDVADDRRVCSGGQVNPNYHEFTEDVLRIEDYVGDLSSSVDIDALQKLGLLPRFVGDITDCIKHNISESMRWTEGYTKKLGYPLGKFNCKRELPNLVIIDVSASIPDGIAATMLTLADTLRSQLNADLIITSRRSGYYPAGCELPKPQTLRDYYGRSNERYEFMKILEQHIVGREWGYVISFGDYDCPGNIGKEFSYSNTKVHEVHNYHTGSYCYNNDYHTGYAEWVTECCPSAVVKYDTSWAKVMNNSYRM